MEQITQELVEQAWALIEEVENLGGMAKAIEEGLPKLRIEEAAARKQARIDSGQEQIVGVNIYQVRDDVQFDILEVDNTAVRESQIKRLQASKAQRNESATQAALQALENAAANPGPESNLLALAIEAARARATLGEISLAMEKAFGRFTATTRTVAGIYAGTMENNSEFDATKQLADTFAEQEGRRPRIMVAKLGQDGHDRGAKVIATAFADLGFDVDIGPLFQTPAEAARQAAENDVHILGISSLAAGHKTLAPQAIAALKELGRDDILVVVGGVIPPQDYEVLKKAGVAAVFGPGTIIAKAASELLNILMADEAADA